MIPGWTQEAAYHSWACQVLFSWLVRSVLIFLRSSGGYAVLLPGVRWLYLKGWCMLRGRYCYFRTMGKWFIWELSPQSHVLRRDVQKWVGGWVLFLYQLQWECRTLGTGIPTILQVNVVGDPSITRKCLSLLSKMGAMYLPVGISSCWTSSSDSSTGVRSRRNSISFISLCSKLEILYSCRERRAQVWAKPVVLWGMCSYWQF